MKAPYYWLNEDSEAFLRAGYLLPGVTPLQRIWKIADHFRDTLISMGMDEDSASAYRDRFLHYLSRGFYSLSSPVWSNYGLTRGLPISCFGSYVPDSMDGILTTAHEIGMMSKYGGGTSAYFGDVRGRGEPITDNGYSEGAVNFMRLYDTLIDVSRQGSTRRGATAVYLPADHPDILEFLEIRADKNPIQGLSFGVVISDEWMTAMLEGNKDYREVWKKILRRRREKGMPYILFRDTANNHSPYSGSKYEVKASNLCVSPDTLILTEEFGYVPISRVVGEQVNVWNGQEWSITTPQVTSEKPVQLLKVSTNSTLPLQTTPEHIFYVQDSYGAEPRAVPAKDLVPGDRLIKFDLPVIESPSPIEWDTAYANGFYSGDGTEISASNRRIYLYNDKRDLLPQFAGTYRSITVQDDQSRLCLERCNVSEKFTVPSITYSIASRLKWLAGLLDSDGTVARNGTNESFQIASTNVEFLYEVQLMLHTLGVNSKVTKLRDAGVYELPANDGTGLNKEYECAAVHRLLISSSGVFTLKNLGLKTHRLVWEGREPQRNAEQFIVVTSVEEGIVSPTMCFTETKRHMGMFNGVLTGQCSEITLPSNEAESFVCCLSSMNLLHYDEWVGTDAVEVMVLFLDTVMEEFITKTETMPGMSKAHRFAKRHRALGLGTLGYHSYLQSHMIPFGSLQAQSINIEMHRTIRDRAEMMSENMLGLFELPDVPRELGLARRNTTLMAIAPTQSSSYILGQVSEGIEPIHSNYYMSDKAKKSTVRKNPYLRQILLSRGADNRDTWDSILRHDGSVQHLDILTDHEKEVFKTFAEISQLDIIIQAADRQEFIDQSQSLNLMIHPATPPKDLHELHVEAWKRGIKSLYYMHGTNPAQEYNRDLLNCSACQG